MLKISQKTEYALRAMLELATRSDAGLTSAREISERQRIPLRFLEQQLGSLSKAGLVESFRGAGGGCRLAKEPADITVADVVDAIEGPFYPMFCLDPADHTCWPCRPSLSAGDYGATTSPTCTTPPRCAACCSAGTTSSSSPSTRRVF